VAILTTISLKPLYGQLAEAIEATAQLRDAARTAGATFAAALRVTTGPNVGNLMVRLTADNYAHTGEISAAMYAAIADNADNKTPPYEPVNILRSRVLHQGSAGSPTPGSIAVVNTMAMSVHSGRIEEAQARMTMMADLNVAAGAVQSRASVAISGMPGPHVFLTTAWGAYGDLDSGMEKIMSSPEMQAIRASKDPLGTIVATFQAIPLG
jgi:hypothetical protein